MKRRLLALVALWAGAFGLRALYHALADPPRIMEGLTHKYLVCAGHFLNGDGFMLQVTAGAEVPYVDRLPGYVLVLALLKLAGLSGLGMVLAHCALGALQSPLLVLLGRRTVGERAGWWAAAGWALFPPSWLSDTQVLETGITGVSLLLCCLALAALVESPSWTRGLLLAGAGSLSLALRADNLLVPGAIVLVAAWLLPRAHWRYLLPGLVLPVLLLLPWGLRNARVADGFFISAGAGNNLLQGYAEFSRNPEAPFGDRNVAASEGHPGLYWPEPGRRDKQRRDKAIRLIASDPVGWLTGCLRRVPILLSLHAGELWPGGEGLKDHVRRWRAENPEAARFEGLLRAGFSYLKERPLRALLTLSWGPLLLLLALGGAWRLRRGPQLLLLLLWSPAYGLLLHLPLHAEPRYFLPHAGVLALVAAGGLLRRERQASGKPRLLALLGALEDARCRRRLQALRQSGFELEVLGFRRDDELEAEPGAVVLGRLSHGRYGSRLLRYLAAWPRIATAAWRADAVMAFGSDLGVLARASTPDATPLVIEIADVREALVGRGLVGRRLRRLEGRALRASAIVVATSPELRDSWLVEQQGVERARVVVLENKPVLDVSLRPASVARGEGPLRIGWFGLLRCEASWRVLSEAVRRSEGGLELLLRGIARDLPGLERQARDAPGVEWGGAYRSPEDLGELYGSVDVVWIAHLHGRTNKDWARANRFYEGGFFAKPLIAQQGTPDGSEVEEQELGLVLDLEQPGQAVDRILKMDRDQVLRWSERLQALPAGRFAESSEQARFAARIRSLLEPFGVEFRDTSADGSSGGASA